MTQNANKEVLFSFFNRPIRNTFPARSVTFQDVYEYITGDAAKERTLALRSLTDKDQADDYKAANFDYVTFGGTFTKRANADLLVPSGHICLDLDDVPNIRVIFEQLLLDDEFETALLFTSPSGTGLKWVVPIGTENFKYEDVFTAISRYLKATYGLIADKKCKDISRACFLPYDPDAYVNPQLLHDYAI